MVVGAVLSGAVAMMPTIMNIGSKVGKQYSKYGSSNFSKAAQFGLGYGASTAVGYNLVPQFGRSNTNKVSKFTLSNDMPYGRTRKIRVWSRRYRRYIWVFPRRYNRSGYKRSYRRGYY